MYENAVEKIKNQELKTAYKNKLTTIENEYKKQKEEEKDKNDKNDKPTNTTPEKNDTTPNNPSQDKDDTQQNKPSTDNTDKQPTQNNNKFENNWKINIKVQKNVRGAFYETPVEKNPPEWYNRAMEVKRSRQTIHMM